MAMFTFSNAAPSQLWLSPAWPLPAQIAFVLNLVLLVPAVEHLH